MSSLQLNSFFVRKVLRNFEKDNSIKISDMNVTSAAGKGDNYGSELLRVNTEFSRIQDGQKLHEKRSLLVKVLPDGPMGELAKVFGSFDRESRMLLEILPKMNASLETLGFSSLSGQCLASQSEDPIYIVIEDLVPKGFRVAVRQLGLDLDHSLLAVRNIGRFHAASVALKEKDPAVFTSFNMTLFHKDQSNAMVSLANASGKALAAEVATWPEISPRIPEKIQNLTGALHEKIYETLLADENEFSVLNHGDCWVNNMMFRYDEQKKPIDHIFVDFQISNYMSPAMDILYFLGTSPADDVRMHHRELLLREYHTSLIDTMAKLKCTTEPPSFDQLQKLLERRAFWEFVASMLILPVVVLEKGEKIEISEAVKADSGQGNPAYRGKAYRKIMTRLLPLYDNMGLLDV